MTQEEKKLLLKDICARIPYGLKASVRGSIDENITFDILSVATNFRVFIENRFISVSHYEDIEVVRPYLRRHSSMTEEEKKELKNLYDITPYKTQEVTVNEYGIGVLLNDVCSVNYKVIDWFHAHHINYRLPDNLFIEAPKEMYNN